MCKVSFVLSILAVSIISKGPALAQELTDSVPAFPAYSIEDTEVRSITSSFTGSDYIINIFLPPGYHGKHERHPVVYVTDASSHFSLMARISRLSSPNLGLNFIVVGIEIRKDDPIGQWGVRSRDLLPEVSESVPHSGGAENYVRFFQEELFPFIDSNYNTNPKDRTFCGHSWGGLFGIYALLNHTETFNRYVLSSPSTSSELFDYEEEYSRTHTDMPVNLYVSQGEFELGYYEKDGENEFIKLMEKLESRNYENLDMKWKVLKDAVHGTASMMAFPEGISSVFSDYIFPDEYVGRYVFSPDYIIDITKENRRFYLKVEGLESDIEAIKYPILGRTDYEKKYYCQKLGGISFIRDEETVKMTYATAGKEFTLFKTTPGNNNSSADKRKIEFAAYGGDYLFGGDAVATVREENNCLFAYFQSDGEDQKAKITSDSEGNLCGIWNIYLIPLSFGKNDKGEVESLTIMPFLEGAGKKVN